MCLDVAGHPCWFKYIHQEVKCYSCHSGIPADTPACQGHVLLAGGTVKGTGPCTLARGRVPTGGHGKATWFQKIENVVTSCILKDFFQKKIKVSWTFETFYAYIKLWHFINHHHWWHVVSGEKYVFWNQKPGFKSSLSHLLVVWSQALYMLGDSVSIICKMGDMIVSTS